MKFAKEIEEDLVPEWRAKYFDYKQAKKKIKAITRAIRTAQKSPATPFLRSIKSNKTTPKATPKSTPAGISTVFSWPHGYQHNRGNSDGSGPSSNEDDEEQPLQSPRVRDAIRQAAERTPSSAIRIPGTKERDPLRMPDENSHGDSTKDSEAFTRYGSIIGSPLSHHHPSRPATLNLPEAAMSSESLNFRRSNTTFSSPLQDRDVNRGKSVPGTSSSAFEIGKTRQPYQRGASFTSRRMSAIIQSAKKSSESSKPLIQRMFNQKQSSSQKPQTPDVPMEALEDINKKDDQFFTFLDAELEKIEVFYQSKEDEATKRLETLREQLHVMRDQRLQELVELERRKEHRRRHGLGNMQGVDELNNSKDDIVENPGHIADIPHGLDLLYHPIQAARQVHFSKKPRNPNFHPTPPTPARDQGKDYTKRPQPHAVPYLTAKRKLKTALQEFYRGLELLKSYALLNRTAFRKINKKYDKAVYARPTMRYVNEKVANAHFVKSTVIDGYLTAVEDLYARYFEKGSHKIAVGKLRRKNNQAGSYTGSVFRNGLLVGIGMVFGIEAIVRAADLLYAGDPVIASDTSYLLQLYAGYFLFLYLFLFFCLDCRIFHENKVNYAFVFEFDTRDNLDWRELAELPCLYLFLLGLMMWLNFARIGGDIMFEYYPVILVGVTALTLYCPLPILYHASRRWLVYSLARLWFGAGIFPVEFRDFFLGDMFCSQTYAMGNIEVFFCLYAHHWTNNSQCNSSNSRLLGFFTALPGIWRAMQCVRRYWDSRDIFPHLVNLGKYTFTILAAMSLSLYRIDRSIELKAFFIACSSINSIYASIWDLLMDWSLFDSEAEHPFLRQHLAYKQAWTYYAAMIIDVLLRFNWIFYVVFPVELQHSAILSFIVALTEVTRRGIWIIFRVENEHCTNVGRFRASRDVALPYSVEKQDDSSEELPEEDEAERVKDREAAAAAGDTPGRYSTRRGSEALAGQTSLSQAGAADDGRAQAPAVSSGTDVERQWWSVSDQLKRRQKPSAGSSGEGTSAWRKGEQSIRSRLGNILRRAHAQDFQRKRRSSTDEAQAELDSDDDEDGPPGAGDDSDDEDHHHLDGSSNQGGQHEDQRERRVRDAIEIEDDRVDAMNMRDAETLLHRARSGQDI